MSALPALRPFVAAALIGLSLAVAAPAHASSLPSTNVAWQTAAADADVDRAFALARQRQQPVLLYWGASWCPPCNQMKATFFNRADFAQIAKGFVAVNVDGDKPGAQKLGSRFKVSGYPTVVLFRPDGTEITRLPGEAEPERLMALLQLGMSGGRPAKAVLADLRAGTTLSPGDWRMLAFYGWGIDEEQLLPRGEVPGVLADIAQKAETAPGVDADLRTRLWLQAIAASDDGQGLKPDAVLRGRVQKVLDDPALVRRHADLIAGNASSLVKALTDEESAERSALSASLDTALRRLAEDKTLSRGDRLGALVERVEIARIGQPRDALQPNLPKGLADEVRAHTLRDDREITDGYERQAVITGDAYALGRAGLWAASDALLKANLTKSHSPYYLMSQLGGNARKHGKTTEALRWYEQAWTKSEGPATRLQWGTNYLSALVDLAPKDGARIERVATQVLDEAAKDSGAFAGRSANVLQRMGKKLAGWNGKGENTASLQRLQHRLDGVCRGVDAADGQRAACEAVLKPGKADAKAA
ncbi:MAG: thioredoxin family protein [Rubrivivax sp.]